MAEAPIRIGPLDGRLAPRGAELAALPPAARFSLRLSPAAIGPAEAAVGLALPRDPCRSSSKGEHAALWLGPDEWLLLAPEAEGPNILAVLGAALEGRPYALVDISHRQIGLAVTGPDAASVLNAGCPLDLDLAAFPVGACTRTLLEKAEIVLWRRSGEAFRLEVWRSFASYAWSFLQAAAGEFASRGESE